LYEHPRLGPITSDLMQNLNGKPLFQYWEEMCQPQRNEYIASLIPLSIERKIEFMLNAVPQDAYMMYLKWLQDSLQIESRRDSESIYVDIVRHIVLNTRSDPNQYVNIAAVNGIASSGTSRTIKPISR
jgi:hypothetical protein